MLIGSFSLMALPFLTGYYSKEVIILSSYAAYSIGVLCTEVWNGLYRFFNRAYLVDGLYARLAALLLEFGYITAKTIDRGVLELLGPYGLTNLLSQAARNWAKLDTGFIPHYTLLMLIGLLAFLIFVFYQLLV